MTAIQRRACRLAIAFHRYEDNVIWSQHVEAEMCGRKLEAKRLERRHDSLTKAIARIESMLARTAR